MSNDIARRVAPSGYAGFVPGYVSNGMYGQSWCSMMETLDARKKQPPLTWEDEHRWTTSKLADQLKQEYMARLWAQEQQDDAKRHWNLHQLNRCLDPNVKASTYTGHIPNVNTENLVGASHSKVQIAAQALRHPAPSSLSSPHASHAVSPFGDAASGRPAARYLVTISPPTWSARTHHLFPLAHRAAVRVVSTTTTT